MSNYLALFLVVVAGCARSTGPAPLKSQVQPAAELELLPINSSGELTTGIHVGGELRYVGLAERGDQTFLVRPTGRITGVALLELPTRIAGVPSSVKAFDYMIDPVHYSDAPPDTFTVVASGSAGTMVYTAIWFVHWNVATKAFELGQPKVSSHDMSICETCDGAG